MRRGLAVIFAALATGVFAQESGLPDFATCMNLEAERFEWKLKIHQQRELYAPDFDLWNVDGVDYCGHVGVTLCLRNADIISCLNDLISEQKDLRDAIFSELAPLEDQDDQADLPKRLYVLACALARGTSAGPDCSGAPELTAKQCEAREANLRLQNAVLAWQVGRYLNVTKPASVAGWAEPAPAIRPRARDTGQ